MRSRLWLAFFCGLFVPASLAHAQIAVDLSARTDALNLPVGTTAQRPTAANGMIRYNSSTPSVEGYVNGSWLAFTTGSLSTITLGISASTTNPQRSGQGNTGLFSATTATVSVAASGTDEADFAATGLNLPVASESYQINGVNAHWQDNTNFNLAVGDTAFSSHVSQTGGGTNGQGNVAVGYQALNINTTGLQNVAVGASALSVNTIGVQNTAVGWQALNLNTTGFANTALGWETLQANTTGQSNTAVGVASMQDNTIGQSNAALGQVALNNNTTGSYNTGIGQAALYNNLSGNSNTAVGQAALYVNTTGSNNIAVGVNALNKNTNGSNNTVLGTGVAGTTLATGSNNILIGTSNAVDTPASNTSNFLDIGNVIFATGMTGTLASPAGNVGIGTATPNYTLDVYGGSGGTPALNVTNPSTASFVNAFQALAPNLTAGQQAYFSVGRNAASNNWASFGFTYAGNGSTSNRFDVNFFGGSPVLSVLASGNIGIGTTNPVLPFEVHSNRLSSVIEIENDNASSYSDIQVNNSSGVQVAAFGYGNVSTGDALADKVYVAALAGKDFIIWNSNVGTVATFKNGGNVGIGTSAPTEALDVYGGHLLARGGSTPTTFSGCGTSPSATGTDNSFLLTYGTGTPSTACTVTFGTAWTTAPNSCVISPAIAATAAVMQSDQVYVSSISTTQVVISSTTHVPASSKLYVQCM